MNHGTINPVRRILVSLGAALLVGVLAVVVAPAGPAAAVPPRCANLYYLPNAPSENHIIAHVCVSYEDPPGPAWTTTQVRIWNPPCCSLGKVYALVFYTDGAVDYTEGGIGENGTKIFTERHTGSGSIKFQVETDLPVGPDCLYLIPTSYTQELAPCRR